MDLRWNEARGLRMILVNYRYHVLLSPATGVTYRGANQSAQMYCAY